MAAADSIELRFRIAFDTVWGQDVAVIGPNAQLGENDTARALRLSCSHEEGVLIWQASANLQHASCIEYRYIVVRDSDTVDEEEPQLRSLSLDGGLGHKGLVLLRDQWQVRACMDSIQGASPTR